MDSLSFDSYSAYSDASTPRTPSPTEMLQYHKVYSPVDSFVSDYKGSLLNELYEQEMPPEYQQFENISWHRPTDYPIRRATFPYVRHDQPYPPYEQQYHHSRQEPYPPYHDFEDPNIKLEDTPLMVQQQSNFYRSPPSSCHQIPMPYLPPQSNLPVQHTDDAASKETQYLRRRCFNCHTTEPPSWRRSTLNPGKIVCNKCGLYERTHLRARPLRFDELRSGTKSRKPSKPSTSPKQSKMTMIKKEPGEFGIRRSSVSSGASVHSGSGASDWDDNVSLYSAGSAPPTSFNSPISHNFPLTRDSHSPPQDGGIRLPNSPLSDVASMRHATTTVCIPPQPISRKSHSSPTSYYSPPSLSEVNIMPPVPDYFSPTQSGTSPGGALWVERTEMNSSELVSSPTGSL